MGDCAPESPQTAAPGLNHGIHGSHGKGVGGFQPQRSQKSGSGDSCIFEFPALVAAKINRKSTECGIEPLNVLKPPNGGH